MEYLSLKIIIWYKKIRVFIACVNYLITKFYKNCDMLQSVIKYIKTNRGHSIFTS